MNRYRTYLDDKPKPPKKSKEQIASEVAAFLAAGKQVEAVPRGASRWTPMASVRPKQRPREKGKTA
jgi:hypothetical protein